MNTSTRSLGLSGDLRIYSVPRALARHIEWALNAIFGHPLSINWIDQKLSPGTYAMEYQWRSDTALASKIASTLRGWHFLRFEVREFSTQSGEGAFYRYTPALGMHQATTVSTGDIVIHENRLMTALESSHSYESLRNAVEQSLGIAWDHELESYRRGLLIGEVEKVVKLTV
jgi:Protein of unknown function (DUF3145)